LRALKEIENAKIITYPRSGQNLFRDLLDQQEYSILHSHEITDFLDKEHVITIIRNPIESVASNMAMMDFYKNLYKEEIGPFMVPSMLKKYEETYAWLLKNATYVILYETLIDNPKNTIEKFLDDFSLKRADVSYALNLSKDNPDHLSLVSSKKVDSYPEYLEHVRTSVFLEDAQKMYQKVLSAKVQ
jgi:hypothetical protein